VLSPGPGSAENPSDIGISLEAVCHFEGNIPVLGVCLGHQLLGLHYGMRIVPAPKVMHGKRSQILHKGEGIFRGLPNPFPAMRYHSQAVVMPDMEDGGGSANGAGALLVTARAEDGVIMGIQHVRHPIFGVQFHPESLGTPDGRKILENFLSFSSSVCSEK
jgi:anthranilate synthase/aminodeoxychorismate synthase-like glutamine amidotransferase